MSSLDKSSVLNSLSVVVERVKQRNLREIKCVTYGHILVKDAFIKTDYYVSFVTFFSYSFV